jgi:hypothetical protein
MNENQLTTIEILKGLQIRRNAQTMRMIYSWRSSRGGTGQLIGEGLFALICLVFSIYMAFSLIRAENMTRIQWITTLPFILLGLFITYRGLSIFLNKSVFEITPQEFKTSSGPLPFLGEKAIRLSPSEITRVEWQQIGYSSRGKEASGHGSGYAATYDVVVVNTQGKSEKIIGNINDREYAYAIQGEIARFLRLNE